MPELDDSSTSTVPSTWAAAVRGEGRQPRVRAGADSRQRSKAGRLTPLSSAPIRGPLLGPPATAGGGLRHYVDSRPFRWES